MSNNKTTNNVLTQNNLKDIVCETMLLREVSLYGCDMASGRVYGYNPFTKKCIDVTDYEGPDMPIPSADELGPGKKPGDPFEKWGVPGSIGAEVFNKGIQGVIDFIIDIYLSGIDPEEIAKCIKENKVFSFLGAIYGRPFVKFLPSMAYSAAKGTYSLVSTRGASEVAGDKYITARKAQIEAQKSSIEKIGQALDKALKSAPKVLLSIAGFFLKKPLYFSGLLGVGAYTAGKFMPGKVDFLDGLTDAVDDNVFGKFSYQNWKCFGAVAVTAVLAGIIVRSGAKGLVSIIKEGGNAAVWSARALKDVSLRKSFEKAITKIDSKQLTIFKILQQGGKLPAGAKIALDKTGDFAILKTQGLGDDLIKISADDLPKSLKKYATNGEMVLDPSQLSKELEQISKSIVDTINESAASNMGKVRSTDFYKRLKAFRKIATASSGGPQQVRMMLMKDSSELLQDLIPKLDESLKIIRQNEKLIAKNRLEVFGLIRKFKKAGITDSGLMKIKDDVINNVESSVEQIVNDAIPSLKSLSPQLNKKITDHFTAIRQHTDIQKGIITDLEFARKSIFGDAKMLRELFPKEKTGMHDMAKWLAGEGKEYKDLWSNMTSAKSRKLTTIGRAKDNIIPGLREAVNALFNNSILVVSPFAASRVKDFADVGADAIDSLGSADSIEDKAKELLGSDSEKQNKDTKQKEVKEMKDKDIKQLVAEVLNENSGMGYGKYPYDNSSSDDQPTDDYIEEWKALATSLIRDESRDTAVAIAKILVKDLELFEDVLDLAGQNQSIGSEILRKMKDSKENS